MYVLKTYPTNGVKLSLENTLIIKKDMRSVRNLGSLRLIYGKWDIEPNYNYANA